MVLDDAVDDRKPEAGPFRMGLGGKKRVEDPLHGLPVHAMPRVPHRQFQIAARQEFRKIVVAARFQVGRTQADLQHSTLVTHGMPRIGAEVHDDLVNLGRIGHDHPQMLGHAAMDLDG